MRSFRKRRTRLSLEIYYLRPVDIKRVSLLPQVRSGCFRGENLSAEPSRVAIPKDFPVSCKNDGFSVVQRRARYLFYTSRFNILFAIMDHLRFDCDNGILFDCIVRCYYQ